MEQQDAHETWKDRFERRPYIWLALICAAALCTPTRCELRISDPKGKSVIERGTVQPVEAGDE